MATKNTNGEGTDFIGTKFFTDDESEELWYFNYQQQRNHISATARRRVIGNDGDIDWQKKFDGLPMCVNLNQIDDIFLTPQPDDPPEYIKFKKGLKEFLEKFPEILDNVEPDIETKDKWNIKIARYFGYNETTLALLRAPDGQHFLARSAGYPYGKPAYDKSVLHWTYMNPKNGRLHWNDYIDDIANRYNQDLDSIANELNALSLIPCRTDDPREEFEERAEIERFETREDLAEKYEDEARGSPSLLFQFWRAARGKKNALRAEEFEKVDVNREKWYDVERIPKGYKDTILSKEGVKDLIEEVCTDFGIATPKTVKLLYPKKPSFFGRRNKSRPKNDGLYYPETTGMAIRYHPEVDGFSKHTVLHELGHHIDNLFVQQGTKPGAGHGMRFKKIHMHLMHHYDDVPLEKLLNSSVIKMAYGYPFPLDEDDILKRDFTERRTVDILPPTKKNPTIGEMGGFTYISGGANDDQIPFRDFAPFSEL